jgi:hypothetical protein
VKSTRRRPQRQDASASLSGEGKALFGAWVIRAAKSPHGPRPRWGQIEFVQAAIVALYPHGLPQHFNASKLTRDVCEQLAKYPEYRAIGFSKPVSRPTVLRAGKLLREANK